MAQKWPKITQNSPKMTPNCQNGPKISTSWQKIAQIYLQHLQLFASLWKYGTMEGNWPSFVCIQDTKHIDREARAVPHLPARLHRRRLPLLQQPQVLSRLLRQVSWCRCHEYNRSGILLYLIIQVKQTLRNLECSDLGIKPRYFLIIFARCLLHIKLHTYPI